MGSPVLFIVTGKIILCSFIKRNAFLFPHKFLYSPLRVNIHFRFHVSTSFLSFFLFFFFLFARFNRSIDLIFSNSCETTYHFIKCKIYAWNYDVTYLKQRAVVGWRVFIHFREIWSSDLCIQHVKTYGIRIFVIKFLSRFCSLVTLIKIA